jgi:tetratricopeptide (TPR) repeat protein
MEEIESLDKAATELKDSGKYMEALEIVEQALSLRKTQFGENSEEVKKSYRQLCELCNILATSYLQREDSYLALDLLKRAEVLSEGDDHAQAITYNNLACYYRKTNKINLALKYLKNALNLEQDIPNTHLNLCAVYSQIGKHEKALAHAMNSVIILQETVMNSIEKNIEFKEQGPVLVVAYHNMAVELEYLKRNNEAVIMYSKASSFAEDYLPQGHPIMENVKSVYHNALKEVTDSKSKKKIKIKTKNNKKKKINDPPVED